MQKFPFLYFRRGQSEFMYNGRAISGALSYAIEQVKYHEPMISIVLDSFTSKYIYFWQFTLRFYDLGKQLQLPST